MQRPLAFTTGSLEHCSVAREDGWYFYLLLATPSRTSGGMLPSNRTLLSHVSDFSEELIPSLSKASLRRFTPGELLST